MIELKNIKKVIKENLILDDINLNFQDGKVYGFVGRNGSGKTMLFRAICGLITLSEGSVLVDGKLLDNNSINNNVGLLLENPSFIKGLSGFDNLKMIASINKIAENDRIDQVLEIVGLTKAKYKKYDTYSLGMKQRLAIANVIMEDPHILIFDEPTNAIDEEGVIVLKDIIIENKSNGKIILIASHERDIIEELCDEVIYMKEGRITEIECIR